MAGTTLALRFTNSKPHDAVTYTETLVILKGYILDNPDIYHNRSTVIEGWGWDHASWSTAQLPVAVSTQPQVPPPAERNLFLVSFARGTFIAPPISQLNTITLGRPRLRSDHQRPPTNLTKSGWTRYLGFAHHPPPTSSPP